MKTNATVYFDGQAEVFEDIEDAVPDEHNNLVILDDDQGAVRTVLNANAWSRVDYEDVDDDEGADDGED